MVQFNFHSENHTVTQSGFDTPCDRLAGGIDSGFMPNPTNSITPAPMMMFQVTTTEPVWMYCRQGSHCGGGMVFSINPTAEKSHELFLENALATAQDGDGAAPPPPPPPASSSAPPVVIGSSSVAVAPPPVATPPVNNVAQGSGHLGSGDACSCSCLCSAGGFPVGAGIGSIGGLGGMLSSKLTFLDKTKKNN